MRRRSSAFRLLCLAPLAALLGVGASFGAASADTAASSLTATAPAPGGVAGTDYTISLPDAVQGTRSYLLFVPNALPAGPRPLVVMLPGFTYTSATIESATGFDAGAVTNGALVAYPQGVGDSFNGGACCATARDQNVDDVGFLDRVLDDVESRYAINTRDVAVGGYSNGGIMAYRYACERSARVQWFFAGSAVEVAPACSFPTPVNVLHVHGLVDPTVPWNGTKTSQFFTGGIVPSVSGTITSLMALDGCPTWTTTKTSTLVTKYVATKCRAGASYTVFTSSTMGHHWPTGSSDLSKYGLDATSLTWYYLVSGWAAQS
jgi:polyhydroxybutyrate depolymerase